MNTLVVYFSKFGHTQKIAETIANAISEAMTDGNGAAMAANGAVQVISADELDASDLEDVDLLVMGTPTHRMNLPEAVRPVFDRLPRKILRGTPVAAFDTSYKMSALLSRFTASKRLASKLRKLGGKRLVPPETFYVIEREGPLYDGEIERAHAWAAAIVEKVASFHSAP